MIPTPDFVSPTIQYEQHCRDPSQTSLIWLGLLFSILGVTMLAHRQYGEPPEYAGLSETLFQLYRTRTAQCLLSGDVAKCLPYTIEALRLNATAELNRKDDNRRGLWIMTGVIVRAAVNMGYHRDPAQSPSISVFRAEYRRRVWTAVVGMDDMASFVGGFPRMTASVYSDTAECRNVFDEELFEGMARLPASRPLAEQTPATYLIVKSRLFRALGRVADFNSNPAPRTARDVAEIDRALREAYESVPPYLKLALADGVSASDSGHDTNGTVRSQRANLIRMTLYTFYHKGLILLHRPFLSSSSSSSTTTTTVNNGDSQNSNDNPIPDNPIPNPNLQHSKPPLIVVLNPNPQGKEKTQGKKESHSRSRKRATSSSLALLTLQTSTTPLLIPPQFYQIAQTRQMFLLAGMVLVLELELRRKEEEEKREKQHTYLYTTSCSGMGNGNGNGNGITAGSETISPFSSPFSSSSSSSSPPSGGEGMKKKWYGREYGHMRGEKGGDGGAGEEGEEEEEEEVIETEVLIRALERSVACWREAVSLFSSSSRLSGCGCRFRGRHRAGGCVAAAAAATAPAAGRCGCVGVGDNESESESEVWKGYRVFCRMVRGLGLNTGLDLDLDVDLGDGMDGSRVGGEGRNGGGSCEADGRGGLQMGVEDGDASNGLGMPFDDGFDWVSFFFPFLDPP